MSYNLSSAPWVGIDKEEEEIVLHQCAECGKFFRAGQSETQGLEVQDVTGEKTHFCFDHSKYCPSAIRGFVNDYFRKNAEGITECQIYQLKISEV